MWAPRSSISSRHRLNCGTIVAMSDEDLTDAWEEGELFAGGISHEQHLRIARVLHRPHGPLKLENGFLPVLSVHVVCMASRRSSTPS
jgi:hypothetical protein